MIIPILLLAQIGIWTAPPEQKFPPAHCEKYQHVVHHPSHVSGPLCETYECASVAVYHPAEADSCADDMHEVTEKEWQEMLDRLRSLEMWSMIGENYNLE